LDSNFNNNPSGKSGPPAAAPVADANVPLTPAGNGAASTPPGTDTKAPLAPEGSRPLPTAPVAEAKVPLSAAEARFHSCRWRKAADSGIPDHCTHRDVLPMAGITGFVPESWCSDCGYFKAKRSPRKRPDEGQQSDDWRRW
jgi:hypothetical protein